MELPPPQDNQFLFLDMNAFFASCEQHAHPHLRGKPVVVTPTVAPSGCVIAASYEAKRLGITTGCRVGDAQRRIPNVAVIDARHTYYVEIHRRIAQFLEEEIAPSPIKLSIDEFAIPLDKQEQWTPNAHALAVRVKQRMAEIFSPALRCSIGVGPNLFLAKLGTEIQKPNGLVIIQCHTLKPAYATLRLVDIPGINHGMDTRLRSLGIRTPVEFFQAPRTLLAQAFGRLGEAWWYNLHGYRVDHAVSSTKSISHSHVLAPRLRNKQAARAVLYKLWLKVAERLREKQLATRRVVVVIRESHQRSFFVIPVRPTQNPLAIFRTIKMNYETQLSPSIQPIKIYVVALDLQPHALARLPFFPEDSPQYDTCFQAIDKINATYGRWTVKPASLLNIHDSAPNRIAFHVPDYDMD